MTNDGICSVFCQFKFVSNCKIRGPPVAIVQVDTIDFVENQAEMPECSMTSYMDFSVPVLSLLFKGSLYVIKQVS